MKARLRDAILLTISGAAASLAALVGILMGWKANVVDTVLPGGSALAWLVGLIVVALAACALFAFCRPPGDDRR